MAGLNWWERLQRARLDLAARIGREVKKNEVAAKMGVSPVTYGYWEAGEREPNLDTFVKLAKVLHTTPEWLAFSVMEREVTKHEVPPAASQGTPRALSIGKKRGRAG